METQMKYFNNDPLLKVKEVAEILNISESMVYKLIQTKEIKSVRLNKAVRVRSYDLQIYIETHTTN